MEKTDILKYCKFYHGEKECPKKFNDLECQLWYAEQWICEKAPNVIKNNAAFDIASYIAAYIGKWDPYGFRETIKYYFTKINDNELKEKIFKIYEIF